MYVVEPKLEPKPVPPLKPGQLWMWDFDVKVDGGEEGWWLANRVTSEGRHQMPTAAFILKRGMFFTVIRPDDEGPYELPSVPSFDEEGNYVPVTAPPKRWHVVLIGDVLVWFQHDWFEQCKLLEDVR